MKIDNNASLSAEKDILISAPLDKVWSEFTKIDQWPKWRPGVTFSKLDGPLAVGAVFTWKENGLSVTSTIQLFEPMQRIGWRGKSLGMQAQIIWTFERRNDGTYVKNEASLSGWLFRLLRLFDSNLLEKSMLGSLRALKAYVEEK